MISRLTMLRSCAASCLLLGLAACEKESGEVQAIAQPVAVTPAPDNQPAPEILPTEPTPSAREASPQPPSSAPALDPSVVPYPKESLQFSMGKANYAWHRFLMASVTEAGLVHYEHFKERESILQIGLVVREYGETWLPEEHNALLAYWCNAYNVNVIFQVMMERTKPGFTNVAAIDGFFDTRPIKVAGEPMTLNIFENDRIRPLGDPRIHAALVCAALSCPPLLNEPFLAEKLDAQLDARCKAWVNDPTKNRVTDGKLQISEIFNWYGDDFKVEPYGGVLGFLRHFADPEGEMGHFLKANANPEIIWMPYDWTLNQAPQS